MNRFNADVVQDTPAFFDLGKIIEKAWNLIRTAAKADPNP